MVCKEQGCQVMEDDVHPGVPLKIQAKPGPNQALVQTQRSSWIGKARPLISYVEIEGRQTKLIEAQGVACALITVKSII
jgi:hypothetical protein